MKMFFSLLLLMGGSLTAARAQTLPAPAAKSLPPAGLLVISHVNVVDVVQECVLEDRMVVVRDGCIEAIGHHAPIGRAVQRLDGRGKYLVPGLWDGQTRALTTEADAQRALPLYVAHGITSIRDVSSERLRAELLATVHTIENGTRLGPRVELAGVTIDGPAGTGLRRAANRAEGQAQAEAQLHDGWRGLVATSLLPRDAYLGVAEVAHTWRVPLTGPIPETTPALEAVAAGHRGVEGADKLLLGCSVREGELVASRTHCLNGSRPLASLQTRIATQQSTIVASFSTARCTALGQALARSSAWVVPLLLRNNPAPTDDEPRLRVVPAAVRQRWAQLRQATTAAAPALDSLQCRLVAELQRRGVALVAGSDAGGTTPYAYYGASLLDELDRLVAAGLTPGQALQAATVAPAIATGHRYDLGQVAPDFHADLLLLDDNPLDDIRNLRQVRAVVLRGRVLDRAALAALAAEAERTAQPNLPEPAAAAR